MAIPTLSGSYIDETYHRLVQVTGSGTEFADGLGNPISFGGSTLPGGPVNSIQINQNGSTFTGSSNLTFVNNDIQLTGSILMSGSSYISGVDYIDFDLTASNAGAVGRLKWNDTDGTLDLGLKGGNVTLQLGQEQLVRVVNKTGTNLLEADYYAVRITGAQGQRLKVDLAQAVSDLLSAETLGLVTETINVNQEGFVTISGLVREIDTTGTLQGETWNDGDILYLSPTVPGRITNIKPQAPNHLVHLGYVVYAHSQHGTIFIKPDNGYELDELHNVRITSSSLSYGDLFMYSGSVWTNTKILSGSYTLSGSLASDGSINANSISASAISASTIIGYVANTQTGSFAITGSNRFVGNQTITGSLIISGSSPTVRVTGSLNVSAGITGSLFGTSSWAINAITSSYPISVSGSTLYSVYPVSGPNFPRTLSVVIGDTAGREAPLAKNSVMIGSYAGNYATNASQSVFIGGAAGTSATNAYYSVFIGDNAAASATQAQHSVFIGRQAGQSATNASYSNFIGYTAGLSATNAYRANFIGYGAGNQAGNAYYSNFIGFLAGFQANNAYYSNFIGNYAGYQADTAAFSNFIGESAGYGANNAANSNFFGRYTGNNALKADYSTLIGYKAGFTANPINTIETNNIIIGTSITLEKGRVNSINIGGILFGTGSYYSTDGIEVDSFSGSANGKIGINQPKPTRNFEVSGSVAFTNLTNATQTNVVSIDTTTGQLYYQLAGGGGSVTPATIGQINTGSSADVYVRPGELEKSKFATINIFNYLNFT